MLTIQRVMPVFPAKFHVAIRPVLLLAGLAAVAPPSTASAQDDAPARVRVGIGAKTSPEFPGAASNRFGPLIDVSIASGTEPFDFEAPDDSFDIDLISNGGFSAGPVLALQRGRKNSEVGAPVGKVSRQSRLGASSSFK